jgi:hypothetical protein
VEIGPKLHLVHRKDRRDRLDFEYELFGHDNIRLETVIDLFAIVGHRNSDLPRERNASAPQLDTQALFVDGFQQAWTRVPVHLDRQSDDLFGQ